MLDFTIFLNLFASLLALGLLALFARSAYRTIQRHNQVLAWELCDVSDQQHLIPAQIQSFVADLTNLGFVHLGEYVEKPPDMALDGRTRDTDGVGYATYQTLTWVFTTTDYTIWAEVTSLGQAGKMMLFSTRFADDAYAETSHPRGETITLDDFQAHTIPTSLEAAYKDHQQRISTMSLKHGDPIALSHITDFITWDRIYRRRYLPLKIQALIKRQLLLEAYVTMGLLLLLLMPVWLLRWMLISY